MRKIFLAAVFSLVLLMPSVAWGADAYVSPEFNPLCWEKGACVAVRKQFSPSAAQKELEEGWLEGELPCNKAGFGKCLPAGITKTQIKFGGQSQFTDIGQFILVNYNYILGVAGILAVIMIIIAGAQWATSGGNSEAITSAKKRISGAVVGLLIAYLSYTILNTINPALVNLRLPQTFMIRQQILSYDYCNQAPSDTLFALAGPSAQKITQDDFKKVSNFNLNLNDPSKFVCNSQYFVRNAGVATCQGFYCPGAGDIKIMCAPRPNASEPIKYECVAGNIVGAVTNDTISNTGCLAGLAPSPFSAEGWESGVIITAIEGYAVCSTQDLGDANARLGSANRSGVADIIEAGKRQYYKLFITKSKLEKAIQECADQKGEFKGVVLKVDFNEDCDPTDETHWIGVNGVDLGDNGFYEDHYKEIDKKFLITPEQALNGMVLNIDAMQVTDIDDPTPEGDWKVYDYLLR